MSEIAEYLPYHGVEIPTNGSKWNNEEKYNAALCYVVYGNSKKVAECTGISQRTILYWIHEDWWQKLVSKVCEENKTELNANYSRLLEKTINQIEKQIDNQEVKALDLAKIHGIMFDKRQILNNMPTSISGKTKDISDLASEFEKYISAKTIDVEVTKTEQAD